MSISSLLFLTVFLGASVLCLVRSPAYGIFLYEFVYFLNPQARWWYSQIPHLRYSFIVALMIIVGFLIRNKRFSHNNLFILPQFRWLAALTAIVLLSFMWSIDFSSYKMLSFRYIKYIVFVVLFYKIIDSKRSFDICFWGYVVGVFYICFLAWQMGRTGGTRLEGIGVPDGQEVNGTAAAVVTAVPMLIYMILFSVQRWIQFISLVGLAFVLNGLVLLNSRGAFLALIAAVAFFSYVIFREKGIKSAKWKLAIGIVGGVLLLLYLADDVFWMRMGTLKGMSTETEGGTRVLFWLKTFDMLADHPLGMGFMGYQILSPDYLPQEWLTCGRRAVHSTWFEVLGSLGYQGLIIFIGYISSPFFLARKVKKYLREKGDQDHILQLVALESSFAAFLVAATFINRFFAEMLYWLPAFIAAFANIYMIKPQRKEAVGRIKASG